jgi:hypothetical protein
MESSGCILLTRAAAAPARRRRPPYVQGTRKSNLWKSPEDSLFAGANGSSEILIIDPNAAEAT